MSVVREKTKCTTVGIHGIARAFGGMIFALVYCTAGISGGHINPTCLGALCGAGVVRGLMEKTRYGALGDGASSVTHGYTAFSATDAKRRARDSHVPILAPLPIGFAVFLVHLATIPITGTGINLACSLGTVIIFNKDMGCDDHLGITCILFWKVL
ncbi:hypothetical protein V6N13_109389 [Hibiscus sabdariffa]|uniref:Uncharacterized protein n=1 Tax=Hibiscus sabdariffa TaxID=183260 RepID=A0ABR2FPJ2_9ROSI